MKIEALKQPPAVAPFVPFTITVETPEEAACLAAACGMTNPSKCAEHITKKRRESYPSRFPLDARAILDTAASTKVFAACSGAIAP